MASTRDEILNTTCQLLESQGYHATGLNQIVAESGSPKGSLYYYFPEGKEGLTAEAVERTAQAVKERIARSLQEVEDPGEAIEHFLLTIAGFAESSGFQAGGPITTVAIETTGSPRVNQACQHAYTLWQEVIAERLVGSGFEPEQAARLAIVVIAALEGGVILSRTFASVTPLHSVAAEMRRMVTTAQRG